MAERYKNEAGYSLVEAMVAILLLTIAIVPMFSMFDTGLNTANRSSNYDKARTLANMKLEQARTLPFDSTTSQDLKDNFPEAVGTTTTYNAGLYQSGWKTETGPASADFTNLEYRIDKQYMVRPAPSSTSAQFSTSNTATDLIRVNVTVRWGANTTFTTSGLVTR